MVVSSLFKEPKALPPPLTKSPLTPLTPIAAELVDWLGVASVSPNVVIATSDACGGGAGVFAMRSVEPQSILATIPLGKCISAASACEDDAIGAACTEFLEAQTSQPPRAVEGAILAAFLSHIHAGPEDSAARARFGPYVSSLPWAMGSEHPLIAAHEAESLEAAGVSVDPRRLAAAEATARAAHDILGGSVPESDCFRVTVLVGSRAFNCARLWNQLARRDQPQLPLSRCLLLIPFMDIFNHPSFSALAAALDDGANFKRHTISDGCVEFDYRVTTSSVEVVITAPRALRATAGEELYNWYGNAGFGAPTSEERAEAAADFEATYGFNPWN